MTIKNPMCPRGCGRERESSIGYCRICTNETARISASERYNRMVERRKRGIAKAARLRVIEKCMEKRTIKRRAKK